MDKYCNKCDQWKNSKEDFHKNLRAKDGLHTTCKPCRIKYNSVKFMEWRTRNPDKAKFLRFVAAEKRRKVAV